MRYSGGLLGGSWLTAMTSDLGNGKFDGTWLVLNFDSLGPANWLWGKQYQVYTEVDTDSERYLEFEKWWGDFIQLNGDELQFLVDNLFIGDKLTRNQLQSHDGVTFDVRNITSPIIVFHLVGRQYQSAAAGAWLDFGSISGRRGHTRHGSDDRILPKSQKRASRPLRLHQGGREAGRGVRAADGRHRLPGAGSL